MLRISARLKGPHRPHLTGVRDRVSTPVLKPGKFTGLKIGSAFEGSYVGGAAYRIQVMGGRLSEWEARAMPQHDEQQRNLAREQGLFVRARISGRSGSSTPSPQYRDSSR